jgi:hypothetical protein
LEKFRFYPEIDALRVAAKSIGQVRWFRPEAIPEFLSHVGVDTRLRGWFKPFGTQTGRNAPPAKTFIPAMSSWLRCLLSAPEGRAITVLDWASQEFAVAAALSKDRKMLDAYNSGDPYLAFAKIAGAVPPDGERKDHEPTRETFKSTVLGLQYGMGSVSLARKVSADTNREVPVEEAKYLIGTHQQAFPEYWQWLSKIESIYQSGYPLATPDGWYLWCDNPNLLSVRNFPVQGTSASIMRESVDLMHDEDLDVLWPLHDAIAVEHWVWETDAVVEVMRRCMDAGVEKILGSIVKIRTDPKTIKYSDVWVEKKGQKMYDALKEYVFDDFALLDEVNYTFLRGK